MTGWFGPLLAEPDENGFVAYWHTYVDAVYPKYLGVLRNIDVATKEPAENDHSLYAEWCRDATAGKVVRKVPFKGGVMAGYRQFETGATRDLDTSKHDPEGFLNPLVIDRYNEYMHQNRVQKDGSIRDSDNWQRGIPRSAYVKSAWRHFHDVWLHHRGYGHKAKESLQIALCGLMFNVMGYLYETLKDEEKKSET